ncbi:MAG: nucleoside triphosphate pyrophosphohydrolase [Bacteroidales bacterium]
MDRIKHKKEVEAFDRMLSLMEKVRAECPWDNSQTNDTLRTLTIEELYELSQAILDRNDEEICKELADVLMHVVFYALIGREKNVFDITDVLNSLSDKLIRRHPHVFNRELNLTAEAVEKNWERIKLKEGNCSTFAGIPKFLPSLIKAYRLQDKAKGVGFDWKCKEDVWNKVEEEMDELHTELQSLNNSDKITQEFGDLLFSLINYARFIGVNPDTALEKTNKKFKSRFEYMEALARKINKSLCDMSIEQMENLWEQAKINESLQNKNT